MGWVRGVIGATAWFALHTPCLGYPIEGAEDLSGEIGLGLTAGGVSVLGWRFSYTMHCAATTRLALNADRLGVA